MTTRIDCPLCDWHMDAEPPDVGLYTLGDVFGLGVMQAVATNQFLEKTEREVHEHLSSHPLVEWVQKVAELNRKVEQLSGKESR